MATLEIVRFFYKNNLNKLIRISLYIKITISIVEYMILPNIHSKQKHTRFGSSMKKTVKY